MGHQRSTQVLAALALCGSWGCAQIAGLTGDYHQGETAGAANGGTSVTSAGTSGSGISQSGKGGTTFGRAGMDSGGRGDAGGDNQSAGEAGMSEGGTGGLSTAGKGGATGGGEQGGATSGGPSTAGKGGTTSGGGQGGATSGGTGGAGASGGLGGTPNSGDCNVNADCSDGKCVELSPGGFRTCVIPVPAAMTCSTGDACCPTDPSTCPPNTECVLGPLAIYCGGPMMIPSNVCATSACKVNADCTGTNALCAPAGTLDRKANTCLTGGCLTDKQCTDVPGGKCEPVTSACCQGTVGLYCVYPGTGCRKNADCSAGHCQISGNTAACVGGALHCAL